MMEVTRNWQDMSRGVQMIAAIEAAMGLVTEGPAPQASGVEFLGPADLAGPCTIVLSYNLSVEERDMLTAVLCSLESSGVFC